MRRAGGCIARKTAANVRSPRSAVKIGVMTPVGFLSDPRYTQHLTGPHHPERPDRIRAIARAVREAGLLASPDPFPDFQIDLGLKPLAGRSLVELDPPQPVDEKWLLAVHGSHYVERVRNVSHIGGVLDLGDTPVAEGSFETALLAVGG